MVAVEPASIFASHAISSSALVPRRSSSSGLSCRRTAIARPDTTSPWRSAKSSTVQSERAARACRKRRTRHGGANSPGKRSRSGKSPSPKMS